ncbi:MAG: M48 family metallopeptidase [Treponema sp.]|nr:M48 family metallopeptidase [Treponema sp.]
MKKIYILCLISTLFITACTTVQQIVTTTMNIAVATGDMDSRTADLIVSTTESVSKVTEQISPENEYYIGGATAASILNDYDLYNEPNLTKYLNKICGAITINSEKPDLYNGYYVAVLDSDEINAMATPGGHILITRGLLKCTSNEEELASVIAHEIAHIQKQHSISAIKTSRFKDLSLNVASLAINESDNDEVKQMMSVFGDSVDDVVSSLVLNGFSQEQEFEADAYALELLNNAGYNPHSIVNMLKTLEQNQANHKRGFVKTHPEPKKRIKKIEKELDSYSKSKTQEERISRFQTYVELF